MRALLLVPAVVALGGIRLAGATTYVIHPDGSGDFPTIQSAIDAAVDGDEIQLTDGAFHGTGNRNLGFRGKAVAVRSASGDPARCVIDCDAEERGILCDSGEGPATLLCGVTVRNGRATGVNNLERSGGGLHCRMSSSPTITDCVFVSNCADYTGGAVALAHDASPTFTRCVFAGNTAEYGGGVFAIDQCEPQLVDCVFADNAAVVYGGGLYCYDASPTLVRCVLSQNSGYRGGALEGHEGAVLTLESCTLYGNAAGYGGVLSCYMATLVLEGTIIAHSATGEAILCLGGGNDVMLSCCDVFGNAGGDWIGCIAGQAGRDGNFSADPLFCDPKNGDLSLAEDSPCLPGATGECGLVGAFSVGCGPVSVGASSWGRIKSAYR